MIASEIIDWATIGKVIVSAMGAGIVVTAGFSFMVLGAVRSAEMRRGGRPLEAGGFAVLAAVAAAVCAAAVVGGILALTAK